MKQLHHALGTRFLLEETWITHYHPKRMLAVQCRLAQGQHLTALPNFSSLLIINVTLPLLPIFDLTNLMTQIPCICIQGVSKIGIIGGLLKSQSVLNILDVYQYQSGETHICDLETTSSIPILCRLLQLRSQLNRTPFLSLLHSLVDDDI